GRPWALTSATAGCSRQRSYSSFCCRIRSPRARLPRKVRQRLRRIDESSTFLQFGGPRAPWRKLTGPTGGYPVGGPSRHLGLSSSSGDGLCRSLYQGGTRNDRGASSRSTCCLRRQLAYGANPIAGGPHRSSELPCPTFDGRRRGGI